MVTGYSRGNPIKYINNIWVYEDGVSVDKEERPCTRCGRMPNEDGSDACLGHIEGATSACCGHGKEEGYIIGMDLAKGDDMTAYFDGVRWMCK